MKHEVVWPDLGAHPEFLTVREAQQVLRLGRSSVYALISEGVLPSIRIGRRILVPRDALRRRLDAMLAGSGGQG